ncbi:MgtC/SapB family protein [Paenibacillus sp. S3N08]|uniref:MgtC/SapB family protein n=2 Tax=Paenibacillus agricola TaxID=2716264 RepID=A0ABX0J252_9BACL|nr:MgtC/SapB family protein [Paenibacillus agricola]
MTFATASVWEITHLELTVRMILAVILGGLIGIEREWSNHAAGFRTHILVCLGSATIMLLSSYGFSQFVNEGNVRMDPARLAAQVISGIGFLGAGAILRNGNMIKGLTTAASVWVVAAIGLSVGAGFYVGAMLCTFLVLISLFLLNKWERHLLRHRRYYEVDIQIIDNPGSLGMIATIFGNYDLQIINLKMIPKENLTALDSSAPSMHMLFSLKIQKQEKLIIALEQIAAMDVVLSLESQHISTMKNYASKEERLPE